MIPTAASIMAIEGKDNCVSTWWGFLVAADFLLLDRGLLSFPESQALLMVSGQHYVPGFTTDVWEG
jgi:hypothetical protein